MTKVSILVELLTFFVVPFLSCWLENPNFPETSRRRCNESIYYLQRTSHCIALIKHQLHRSSTVLSHKFIVHDVEIILFSLLHKENFLHKIFSSHKKTEKTVFNINKPLRSLSIKRKHRIWSSKWSTRWKFPCNILYLNYYCFSLRLLLLMLLSAFKLLIFL